MDASEEGMKRVLRAASLLRDQSWRFLRRGCSQALSLSGRSWTQLERPSPEQTKERAKSWTHFAKIYRQVSGKRDSHVMRFLVRSYCACHRCSDQLCIPPGISEMDCSFHRRRCLHRASIIVERRLVGILKWRI